MAAELTYRKGLRQVVELWSTRVLEALGDLSETVETRTDAESPLEKHARLTSRPANDAVGTTQARARVRDELIKLKQRAQGYGSSQGRLIDLTSGKVDANSALEFERVIGVNVKSMGGTISNQINDFRKENSDLITSIPENMIDDVRSTLEESWNKGARVESLRADIQERFDVSKSRADLIARDQTLKLNSQISKTRAESAGISRYVWSTSNDERVRGNPSGLYPNPSKTGRPTSDHYRLEGQTFSYSDPPVVDERTGRRANPGEDYQCRCTAAPVLDFLDDSPDDSED